MEFKVGDRVRVVAGNYPGELDGWVGVIRDFRFSRDFAEIVFTLPNGELVRRFHVDKLAPAPGGSDGES